MRCSKLSAATSASVKRQAGDSEATPPGSGLGAPRPHLRSSDRARTGSSVLLGHRTTPRVLFSRHAEAVKAIAAATLDGTPVTVVSGSDGVWVWDLRTRTARRTTPRPHLRDRRGSGR